MNTITLNEAQWAELRRRVEAMDAAWNMTEDRRDVGEWTIEERYDRLHQASIAGVNLRFLLDEIEAEAAR